MTQNTPERTLIYVHIPKAGGSTMNHILDWNYPNAIRPETNPGYQTRYERK